MVLNTVMCPSSVKSWHHVAELLAELDKNAHAQVLPPTMYSVGLGLTRC